jgi:hypothetical protein
MLLACAKTPPMARKVRASFTKFQALVGRWNHIAEDAIISAWRSERIA